MANYTIIPEEIVRCEILSYLGHRRVEVRRNLCEDGRKTLYITTFNIWGTAWELAIARFEEPASFASNIEYTGFQSIKLSHGKKNSLYLDIYNDNKIYERGDKCSDKRSWLLELYEHIDNIAVDVVLYGTKYGWLYEEKHVFQFLKRLVAGSGRD